MKKTYEPETKSAIEQVIDVFNDYIRTSTHFELLWSDKVGYIYISIIPSENDRFVLVLFNFSFLDEPLFLCSDTLQQSLCRLVRRVLRYQLALDCLLQNRLLESFWEG